MGKKNGVARRSFIKSAAASALVVPATGIFAPSIAQSRDRLIFGTTQEPVQFNPLLYVNTGVENVPESCLFDALWDVNEKGEFIPNLAVRIPTRENGGISGDGIIWRIELRRDVKWSDGQSFGARDVEFTYKVIMDPKVAVRSRTGFDLIKNLKVVDEFTIEIELSRPFVPFYWAWQNMHIIPKHILEKEANFNTSSFNAQPIGTGPYILKGRTPGSHMVYEANPNYHRGKPKIRQFIHKFVPDQLVAYGQARTGEIDYLGLAGIPVDRWEEASKLPNHTLLRIGTPWVHFMYFNCGKPQFSDVRVRRALSFAVDIQKAIADIFMGTYDRTLSYLHEGHWAYNHDLKHDGYNPKMAASLLDEAGWRIGTDGVREKNGVKLKFACSTTAGVPARQATQALFQQNLKAIGVEMEIKNMPASVVWGEYTTKSQFDTVMVSWEPPMGMDPDYTARCHSSMIPVKSGHGSNYTQYKNTEVDRLLEDGLSQLDNAARKNTYDKIQEILLNEVPFLPIGAVNQGHLAHKGIKGIKPNQYVVDGSWNIQDWSWS